MSWFMGQGSMKRAVVINFTARYANIFLQILYNSVLARILSPNDFGIVAVISVFTAFFKLLADAGLGAAIIQRKDLTHREIDSIFSFSVYISIALMGGFAGFSFLLAKFYSTEIYVILGMILSVSVLFDSLNMVPNSILVKEKKFLQIGLRMITVTIVNGIITIILALFGFRYYAIVVHSVLTSLIIFIWNRVSVTVHFSWRIEWEAIKKVGSYSAFQFASRFMNYFSRNLDNLLIGKFIGAAPLGYYDKGYRLMQYPIRNLTHVMTSVLHPYLSDYQDNTDKIFRQYMKVVRLLSIVGAYITPFCFFAADELVRIFFGPQWDASVVSFQYLSLSIWAQMIAFSSGAVFRSLGNTRLLFISGTINSLLNIIFITLGIVSGSIERVALYVAVSYNIQLILTFLILMRGGFKRPLLDFCGYIWKDLIIMAVLTLAFFFFVPFTPEHYMLSFLIKLIVSTAVYILTIVITGQLKSILWIIRRQK